MKRCLRWVAAILVLAAVGSAAQALVVVKAKPLSPAKQAVQAEVIVLGKVVEVENDTVEISPYKGAAPEERVSFKIAIIKIETPLAGAVGLTQLRVGFRSDAPPPAALTAGMEGAFMLSPHYSGDFHVAAENGLPLLKSDEAFAKEVETVKKIAGAIDDPVTALKSKDKAERSLVAFTLLTRYRDRNRATNGRMVEADIPAEESKLLIQAIAEMPWNPQETDFTKPSRSSVWHLLQTDKLGFQPPVMKIPTVGDPPDAVNKQFEEATTKFLKANADKIKIKKIVAGK
ncbi:hypothetical protein [Zavarzinella formosa]|uniref:hypothetical protein n=1 Tax=Zavarzinella formosa TaxID=360055 RepID=UPI000307A8B3|nr:hypothetical protein [Zavarzinella formosa]